MKRARVRPVSSGSVPSPDGCWGARQLEEVVRRHAASPAEWLSRVRLNPESCWPDATGRDEVATVSQSEVVAVYPHR